MNPPLTDEEICRKYHITRDDPLFKTASALARSRPDSTCCEIPDCLCPWCAQEFTATYYDLTADAENPIGSEVPCPECERSMYVQGISEPEDEEYDGQLFVTLCTHNPLETD